jgi:tetratricopeptide (TPR) repeat protein
MGDNWLTCWIQENAAMLDLEGHTPKQPEEDSLQGYLMAYAPADTSNITSPPKLGTVGGRHNGQTRGREMEYPEDSDEDLLFNEEFLYGKRRRSQKKSSFGLEGSTTVKMSAEISKIMGQANQAFVQKDYLRARDLFLQVVRFSPSSHEPYYTLGVIYQELNEIRAALNYYMIAAHLRKNDADLWDCLLELFT